MCFLYLFPFTSHTGTSLSSRSILYEQIKIDSLVIMNVALSSYADDATLITSSSTADEEGKKFK